MIEGQFLKHVGDRDIHDATIIAVEQEGTDVRVVVDAYSKGGGRRFTITFYGVEQMCARRPEGMILYALAEWTDKPPRRRFVFANWYEDWDDTEDEDGIRLADSKLELIAAGFSID